MRCGCSCVRADPDVTMPRTPSDARRSAETAISKKISIWLCQATIEWLRSVADPYAALSRNQDPNRTNAVEVPSLVTLIKLSDVPGSP